jgi:hypothetical protein
MMNRTSLDELGLDDKWRYSIASAAGALGNTATDTATAAIGTAVTTTQAAAGTAADVAGVAAGAAAGAVGTVGEVASQLVTAVGKFNWFGFAVLAAVLYFAFGHRRK